MRKVLLLGVLLLFLGFVNALTLNVKTIPGVLTPGTSGKLILEITASGSVRSIYVRIPDASPFEVEDEGSLINVGDASGGTVSYVLWLRVPDSVKPGVYVLPVEITYTDVATGNSYTEHFAPLLTVTSGKGLEITFPEKVYGGVRKLVKIAVENTGAPIYNAVLTVPDAVGDSRVYIGDLDTGERAEKYVEILPSCEGGLYRTELTLTGYRGTETFTETVGYTAICIPPEEDLKVTMEIPPKIGGGEQNTHLIIHNLSSLPKGPLSVNVSGINVRFGGQTSFYVNSVPPGSKVTIPIVWKLEKSDEPGIINVVVAESGTQRMYSFSVLPADEPDIVVYLADVPVWENGRLRVNIAVANVGTGTAENVFVETNSPRAYGGKDLLGDLGPGDYDTTTLYLEGAEGKETVHVRVEYTAYGEKRVKELDVEFEVPSRPADLTPILLFAVVLLVAWWWRKRK